MLLEAAEARLHTAKIEKIPLPSKLDRARHPADLARRLAAARR
jgi:hypothetical protein